MPSAAGSGRLAGSSSSFEFFSGAASGSEATDGIAKVVSQMVQRPRTEAPPPGAYELQDLWNTSSRGGRSRGSKDSTFISSSPRFMDDVASRELTANPGPGTYSSKPQFDSAAAQQLPSRSGGSSGRSIRFKDPDSFTPGPGSYHSDYAPSHSMVKRSFNVTIDGE